jgi:hypothetical protein
VELHGFQPALRKSTIFVTLSFIRFWALSYRSLQQTARISSGLAEVQKLASHQIEQAASGVRMFQQLSALCADHRLAATPVASLSNQGCLRFSGL